MKKFLPIALLLLAPAVGHAIEARQGADAGPHQPTAVPEVAPQKLVESGLGKLRRGDFAGAVADLRAALAGKPSSAAIATDLGFALGKQGNLREAEVILRRAMELDPRRFYAYVNLADLLAQSPERFQRGDEVIARLERGLGNLQGNERSRVAVILALANFERSLGRLAAARARLQPLLADASAQPPRLRELSQMIDADEAGLALRDWPETRLSEAERQSLNQASVAVRRGQAGLALDRTATVLASKPGSGQARFLRGRALAMAGRFDEAVVDLSLLLQFRPSHAEGWRLLGTLLAEHGGALELGRADLALRRALALEPAWEELREARKKIAARRQALPGQASTSTLPVPSAKARELFREAEGWIDDDAPELAEPLLSQALAESPAFVDAAAVAFSLTGKVPEPTVRALWGNGPALARLCELVLAQRGGTATDALVRPWLDRAIERGGGEARFGRALLRGRGGDKTGALSDLQIYVTSVPDPPHLAEARMLRSTLAGDDTDTTEQARRLLLEDRPEAAEQALGGPCRTGLPTSTLIDLGRVREYQGDRAGATVCYRLAADHPTPAEQAPALGRLVLLAARLPEADLAPLEPYLRKARGPELPLAAWALSRLSKARGANDEALALARAYLAQADADDPYRESAARMIAELGAVAETDRLAGELWRRLLAYGVVGMLGLSLLVFLRWRFRGNTLYRAVRRRPDFFPDLARALAEIRHDLLKHRASALGMAGPAEATEAAKIAVLSPEPLSRSLDGIYQSLIHQAAAQGLTLRPLGREPVLGPLLRDFQVAEKLLARPASGDDEELRALDGEFREVHGPRLQALLVAGPRTRLDPARLLRFVDAVEAELGVSGWPRPAVLVETATVAVPVPEATLGTLVTNLLRNAAAAVAGRQDARLQLHLESGRDITGRRLVSLLVADSSPVILSLTDIEARDGQRGLGIVRDSVRRWGGHLVVRSEPAPLCKSIGVVFPAAVEGEEPR